MKPTDLDASGAPDLPHSITARARIRERAAEIFGRADGQDESPATEHLGSPAPLHWSGLRH